MFTSIRFAICTAAIAFATHAGAAAEMTLKTEEKPVPNEIGETIRAVLQPRAVQLVTDGKPSVELWLRKDVPLKSKPSSPTAALGQITETTLIGAVAVHGGTLRDYKDNEVPKGIYTARFALQPQDGDHLGTAEYPYFLLLIAANRDTELTGIERYKPMVNASGRITASGHPVVLSLRPAAPEGTQPSLTEPASHHKALRLKIPAKAAGSEESLEVSFDLVYEGAGEH